MRLDFSKAFDCKEHGLLIEKLEQYGIRNIPNLLLTLYLSDRTLNTEINTRQVVTGKVQGTGPIWCAQSFC